MKLLEKLREWHRRDQECAKRFRQKHPKVTKFRLYFLAVFPSVRAYVTFMLTWVFFIVLTATKELVVVLVSALGTIYCLNEWVHAMKEGRVSLK